MRQRATPPAPRRRGRPPREPPRSPLLQLQVRRSRLAPHRIPQPRQRARHQRGWRLRAWLRQRARRPRRRGRPPREPRRIPPREPHHQTGREPQRLHQRVRRRASRRRGRRQRRERPLQTPVPVQPRRRIRPLPGLRMERPPEHRQSQESPALLHQSRSQAPRPRNRERVQVRRSRHQERLQTFQVCANDGRGRFRALARLWRRRAVFVPLAKLSQAAHVGHSTCPQNPSTKPSAVARSASTILD